MLFQRICACIRTFYPDMIYADRQIVQFFHRKFCAVVIPHTVMAYFFIFFEFERTYHVEKGIFQCDLKRQGDGIFSG